MLKHQAVLERLGLTSLEGVKNYQGELVKDHWGRRSIVRISTEDEHGQPLVMYLKRYGERGRKDGLASILRRGSVWSIAYEEWHNSDRLARAGYCVPEVVAYGDECAAFWETYSFILTKAAPSKHTLFNFMQACHDRSTRRRVILALAEFVRRLHENGLAIPDLFARHIFFDEKQEPIVFCLIDVARLVEVERISMHERVVDLTALNISSPLRFVSPRERILFLHAYGRSMTRKLFPLIRKRLMRIGTRTKYRNFFAETKDDKSGYGGGDG